MIVRPKPNLIGVLTSLKGSIAKRIAWRSLLVTLLASAIVLIERDVLAALGVTQLPPQLEPVDYVLN
ncbi:bestrophin family ion channel [Pseudomonas sp.]|jgi:predicted membrane chloride channel (bestrophin family)|uniref:bestrophin family ion channel n=1 Tax=Pseudomonas sp. TaxID=306 RepID=UPI003263634F